MSKKIAAVILMLSVLFSCFVFGSSLSSSAQTGENDKSGALSGNALTARLEHMLNLNRLYNGQLDNETAVIEESAIALKDKAQDGYIEDELVESFVYSMYALTVDTSSVSYSFNPEKDGCLPIVPKGYTAYSHKVTGIDDNGDGTITVRSDITLNYHDDKPETFPCETLFCQNDDSAFSYNIVYSDILS